MNDELLNYDSHSAKGGGLDEEITPTKRKVGSSRAGNKLSTIFLVVLGLHVVVIVGISAFHLIRGNKSGTESAVAKAPGAEMDVAGSDLLASGEGELPEIDTPTQMGGNAPVPAAIAEDAAPIMPMPASQDPIWNRDGTMGSAESSVPAFSSSSNTSQTEPVIAESTAVKESSKSYTVVKGDTLSSIARKMGVKVSEIKSMNGLSTDVIRIGQKLDIPGHGSAMAKKESPSMKTAAPTVSGNSGATGSYQVAKGDTLWKIAKEFNTTVTELKQMNQISDPKMLKVGAKIKVPSRAPSSTQALQSAPVETGAQPVPSPRMSTDMAMLREAQN